jgi:hypothetical protein
VRALVLLIALTLLVPVSAASSGPGARASATCSDYANQREAQLHHDTIDRDHDGIYCEDLPCPCLKPSGGSAPPSPDQGEGPALFHGRCKRGRLPDYRCTPGAVFKRVTADDVCAPGYSEHVRNVPESRKRRVYLAYGIRRHRPGAYEIDHLVSLELGGNNFQRNLWPEKQPGARAKDKVENALHRQVCDGSISLKTAQREIRHWRRVQLDRGPKRAERTEEARSGNVVARLTYTEDRSDPYITKFSDLHLSITRAGAALLDAAIGPPCPRYCGAEPARYGERHSVVVRDVDADSEPEVIVDVATGGAHCCVWAYVYRFAPERGAYSLVRHNFADFDGYRLADPDRRGPLEFVSSDRRFAYEFTAYAFSGFPVQIWRLRAGRFVDSPARSRS